MARKTKCTPEVQKAVTDALSMGSPVHLACDYAGITQESYFLWLRRGAKGEKPYAEFADAIQKAQGRSVVGWLAKIEAAASAGNWQAAAWKLERRYPKDFGRMIVEHTGEMTQNIIRLPVRAATEAEWLAAHPPVPTPDKDVTDG